MGRLDLPDPVRDEDIHPCTCASCNPSRPEIGSVAWVMLEIAAGRSGEERDRP